MNSLILALHLTAAASAGAPETSQQNSWSPWFGCWQAQGAPAGELICIKPTNNGVVMTTVVDGKAQDESVISADGLARRMQQQDCNGTERARWSQDGKRVFLDSDVSCAGNARRVVRGMFAFVAPNEWISVQSATAGDSVATRLVRFVAANPAQPIGGVASFTAGSAVTEEMLGVEQSDVAEAVEHLGATAAQEWMREAGEPFKLGYDDSRASRGGSALDQVGRFSNPESVVRENAEPEIREIVRVVERPVYVHDDYYYDHYRWHYSPWGYRYYGWHWWHRPVVVVHFPIVIFGNRHYRHDYYHYRTRWYDYDRRWSRNDHWRRDRDRGYRDGDRYREDNGGRVTRNGYSNDRGRTRSESTTAQIERTTSNTTDTGTRTRTRTATPRERTGSVTRVRTSDTPQRSTESRERASQSRESGNSSSNSTPRSSSGSSSRGSDGGSRSAKLRGSR